MSELLDRAVKTLKSGVRVWFAVLLFSAAAVCAICAKTKVTAAQEHKYQICQTLFGVCQNNCTESGDTTGPCYEGCINTYYACMKQANKASIGEDGPGQSPPPNKAGPNPTPTPRRLSIKGPPHQLGTSPTPSATAHPILLAKPATPTPTPKSTSNNHHSHH